MTSDASELTCDAISGGAVEIFQAADGYRFGLDAILLATDLPEIPDGGTVVELGAGAGAVSLSLASRRPDLHVVAVERQASLLELLRRNTEHNEMSDSVTVVDGDVRHYRDVLSAHEADLVLCNPPYRAADDGRLSPNEERAASHHELHGTLADFVHAAAYVARPNGSLKLISPPARLSDLFDAVSGTDLRPATLRFVHARPDRDAYLVEFAAHRGRSPTLRVKPPLYVHEDEDYSSEVRHRLDHAARRNADV